MFIGHAAVGFAAKKAAPGASLGVLMMAPMFLDLLWPIFLLVGIESVRIDPGNTPMTPLDLHDYPWSHSLVMAVAWSVVVGGGYGAVTRYRRGALVVGLGVFSHWALDFVTHRPDMPLWPGSATYVGLGLWYSRAATIAVESVMFVAAVWLYLRATRARDRIGRFALAAFIGFLVLVYLAAVFGPPPPNVKAVALGALAGWLLPLWAWRIDRHRVATG